MTCISNYFSPIAIYPFKKDKLFKKYTVNILFFFLYLIILKTCKIFKRHNPDNWQTGKYFSASVLERLGKFNSAFNSRSFPLQQLRKINSTNSRYCSVPLYELGMKQ